MVVPRAHGNCRVPPSDSGASCNDNGRRSHRVEMAPAASCVVMAVPRPLLITQWLRRPAYHGSDASHSGCGISRSGCAPRQSRTKREENK
ncbi:hypothetical protein BHE74_00023862, partial [Ensete ventricosum]